MATLEILCPLGHAVTVPLNQAGQRMSCPACQIVFMLSPGKAMPKVEIYCPNNHLLQVKQKYVGKKVRCPSCRETIRVSISELVRSTDQPRPKPTKNTAIDAPSSRTSRSSSIRAVPIQAESIPEAILMEEEVVELHRAKQPGQESEIASEAKTAPRPSDASLGAKRAPIPGKQQRRIPRTESAAWDMADTGLGVSSISSCAILATLAANALFAFLFLLILRGVSSLQAFNALATVAEIFGWLFLIAYLAGGVGFAIGGLISLAVPAGSGAKVWSILQTTLTLIVMATLGGLWIFEKSSANQGIDGFWKSDAVSLGMSWRSHMIIKLLVQRCGAFAAWACFVALLWQLAKTAHRPKLSARAIYLLVAGLAFLLVMLGLLLIPELAGMGPQSEVGLWVYQILSLLVHVGGCVAIIIWQFNVTGPVRNVIRRSGG